MSFFDRDALPTPLPLLMALYDIRGFTQSAKKMSDLAVFEALDVLGVWIGGEVAVAGGLLLKLMGDSGLIVFPQSLANRGIQTLFEIQAQVKNQFKTLDFRNLDIHCHFGEVVLGYLNRVGQQQLDIIGSEVNTLFLLSQHPARGNFVISPQAFRQLEKSTRQRFHKFTPQVVYTGV